MLALLAFYFVLTNFILKENVVDAEGISVELKAVVLEDTVYCSLSFPESVDFKNKEEFAKQKEILFIQSDLQQVRKNVNKYCKIIAFYKDKLVELGVMKKMPNKCVSRNGSFVKKKAMA